MLRSLTRILSFFSQWMAEVIRQPGLMISLVIGPFLILFLFGEGETVGAPRPRTVLVMASGEQQSAFAISPKQLGAYLDIVGVSNNEQAARQELVNGNADLVVVIPGDPTQTVRSGKHVELRIYTNEIDPIKKSYEDAYIHEQVSFLNEQAVKQTIAQLQVQLRQAPTLIAQAKQYLQSASSTEQQLTRERDQLHQLRQQIDSVDATLGDAAAVLSNSTLANVGPVQQLLAAKSALDQARTTVDTLDNEVSASGGTANLPSADQIANTQRQLDQIDQEVAQFESIPPDVLSAPFTPNLKNVAPFIPTAIGYYAPAVLALLLQHLAITLGALSMTRVRLLGLMELFQTSPVKPVEVTIGNYLSYGVLCCIAGALLVLLLVYALGVPIFGSVAFFVAMLLLLIFSSLGIGFFISMISSSEQQAAQLAMLMLIGAVFFSGFLVSLDTITIPVRYISYIFPATYAIRTLDDVMLRGVMRTPWDYTVLGGIGVAFFIITVLLFRREFRPR